MGYGPSVYINDKQANEGDIIEVILDFEEMKITFNALINHDIPSYCMNLCIHRRYISRLWRFQWFIGTHN